MTAGESRSQHLMRPWLIALSLIIFFWSGVEDDDVVTVTALGLALSLTLALRLLISRLGGAGTITALRGWLALPTGAGIGALTSLTTVALMLFKDLRHAHPFPDYPPGLMLALLERLPAWSVAGALIGLGLCLLLQLRDERG